MDDPHNRSSFDNFITSHSPFDCPLCSCKELTWVFSETYWQKEAINISIWQRIETQTLKQVSLAHSSDCFPYSCCVQPSSICVTLHYGSHCSLVFKQEEKIHFKILTLNLNLKNSNGIKQSKKEEVVLIQIRALQHHLVPPFPESTRPQTGL